MREKRVRESKRLFHSLFYCFISGVTVWRFGKNQTGKRFVSGSVGSSPIYPQKTKVSFPEVLKYRPFETGLLFVH